MKINKRDLKITVSLKKAIQEQISTQIEQKLYDHVTKLKDEMYEEADKIAKKITPIYTKQVIEGIREWMKSEEDSQSPKKEDVPAIKKQFGE